MIGSHVSMASIFSERMKKPNSLYLQKSIVNLINPKILKEDLNDFLAITYPGRSYRNQGHQNVAVYFDQIKKQTGIKFEKQNFSPNISWAKNNLVREFDRKIKSNYSPKSSTYIKWNGFIKNLFLEYDMIGMRSFQNYVWKKAGADQSKTLVISANIDSVGQDPKTKAILHQGDFFGASDNASSVVSLLNLTTVLNKMDLPFNVMVVFFDLQEFGNLGAHAFVSEYLSKIKNTEILHINSLMISKLNVSKKPKDFFLYGPKNKLSEHLLSQANILVPEAKLKRIASAYISSDSGPFIDEKIASLTLIGLDEKEQKLIGHKISDTVEMIDFYHFGLGAKLLYSLALSALYPL